MADIRVPTATYRVQFNPQFGFDDARTLIPYLRELGISDLYCSPILQARYGSPHGYDVTDALALNRELGTEEQFEELTNELRRCGMGLLLDIVPNHMAASPQNLWWMDVLENGPSSCFAPYFDIDWSLSYENGTLEGKVLLPILATPFEEVVEEGHFRLGLDDGGLFVDCNGIRLPLDPTSYGTVLGYRLDTLRHSVDGADKGLRELTHLLDVLEQLPPRTTTTPERVQARYQSSHAIKARLWRLYQSYPQVKSLVDNNLGAFNHMRRDAQGRLLMEQLLGEQAYQLEFWRTGVARINYRRFFDISDLVGVRVEEDGVLEATHARIFQMVWSGQVTGLRVDHIDGLLEPQAYLHRLQAGAGQGNSRERAGKAIYVVVEKILGADENLPQEWAVCGTTGYEFLDAVNGVFVDAPGYNSLRTTYESFTGCESRLADVAYEQKKKVIEQLFVAELARLARRLRALAQQDEQAGDLNQDELMRAILEVTACCPVYRTYVRDFDITARDRNYIARSLEDAKRRSKGACTCGLRFLGRVLILDFPPSLPQHGKSAWLQFVMQWQQFTGPAMAKGLEDTALYTYNALLSLNEVGSHPEAIGSCVSAFHRHNQSRLRRWRHALSATSTHDTKRSEDVRARINVLSELHDEWSKRLKRWSDWNRPRKQLVDGRLVPDSNEEIHLYQTLLGAWPLQQSEVAEFKQRVLAYVVKAAREAKNNTSWTCVNEAYEAALTGFVEAILGEDGSRDFLPDFVKFQKRIAFYGMLNALAQVLLKIASPGVPDLYQGTELWDFSLVDPDNRRAVDFTKRRNLLDDLKRREREDTTHLVEELLHKWDDGRVKLYLTYRALCFRQANTELFAQGDYLPVYASGVRAENVVAFARRMGSEWGLVAVPRLSTRLVPVGGLPLGSEVWGSDHLFLPVDAPSRWRNIVTGEAIQCQTATTRLPLSAVFRMFPVALLSSGITGDSHPLM